MNTDRRVAPGFYLLLGIGFAFITEPLAALAPDTASLRTEQASESDLGDAPDGSNGSGVEMTAYPQGGPPSVKASFPTVFNAGVKPAGPLHLSPSETGFLGSAVTLEQEADTGWDADDVNNLLPSADFCDRDGGDDGVQTPIVLTECSPISFNFSVTVVRPGVPLYVNVWIDWNRDGDWDDAPVCPSGAIANEWAVQNQPLPDLAAGTHMVPTPSFIPYHPESAIPRPVWMRVTLSEMPWNSEWLSGGKGAGCGPPAGYAFGETEDYCFVPLSGQDFDWGDAPAPYPTLDADGGPYHYVTPGLCLGSGIDPESDGLPGSSASGDDSSGLDDEDGVTFDSVVEPGKTASLTVTATGQGFLNAWMDFNRDGDWNDVGEKIADERTIAAGRTTLDVAVPVDAAPGVSFSRFRFSQTRGLGVSGPAPNGEVEDHSFSIAPAGGFPLKWDQALLKLPVLFEPDGLIFFSDGWGAASAVGDRIVADDWICLDPGPVTGIVFWGAYAGWDSAAPPPEAPAAFQIGLWSAGQASGDTVFGGPAELIRQWLVNRSSLGETDTLTTFRSVKSRCFRYSFELPPSDRFVQAGDSTVYWLSVAAVYGRHPQEHAWGWLTRNHYFRDDAVVIFDPATPSIGDRALQTAPVEMGWDAAFQIKTDRFEAAFDWGDALGIEYGPMPDYPTLREWNGACHFIRPGVHLGSGVDAEPDGQPDIEAAGDGDDEDGVLLFQPLLLNATNEFQVEASCAGVLNAWIDFHGDGGWTEKGDQLFLNAPLTAGTNTLQFQLPADLVAGDRYARFRFSTEPNLKPFGLAVDGEVEDYLVRVAPSGVADGDGVLPFENRLARNYPNPFNPSTRIGYSLARPGRVRLALYDLMGREIAVLVESSMQAGNHAAEWDGRDGSGRPVPGGLYLCRIESDGFTKSRKLLLVK
ncbi:T9SS type A sorting domain-containing protein [bacterium]|nr:T9SS type A sorting domain-containing protein [bacterium]